VEQLDLALRGAAIVVLLLLAVLMAHAPVGRDGRLSVAAVAVTKSAFLLLGWGGMVGASDLVLGNLTLLASAMPLAVTWLLLAIFLDPPTPRWPWLAAGAVASTSFAVTLLIGAPIVVCSTLSALLYGGLVVLSLASARDDLVDCRCRARPGFAAAIAGYGLTMTVVQALGVADPTTPWFALLQSGGTLALALAFALWILRPAADRWPGPAEPAPTERPVASTAPTQDAALIAHIAAAMDAGIWREESLTIGTLVARLAVPEHRLRRAINQGLGHRNFSSFINRARIAAAQETLADPAQMGRTILEIAYDVGFASLGPFNRAFRAETGQSPSEFRREALAHPPADAGRSPPIPVNLH